jgi:lipoprotein-anchoring transpeptidase ErfK/SrfK
MKLGNGKGNQEKKATWVLGAVLAMTTVGSALQVSFPVQPGADAPELAKATVRWVLVSIPDRKLALFENGRVVRIYPVAVGKISTPSPVGEFKIVNRVTNPTYYHKGQIIAAGKGNPVGTRWMGLSAKGYGIHGTNQPNSIGKAASTGCIRMSRKDLEAIFTIVDVGDTVQIRAERNEQIAAVFGSGSDAPTDAATMARVETEKDADNGQ